METRAVMLREFSTSWQSAEPPEPRRSDAAMETEELVFDHISRIRLATSSEALGSGVFANRATAQRTKVGTSAIRQSGGNCTEPDVPTPAYDRSQHQTIYVI